MEMWNNNYNQMGVDELQMEYKALTQQINWLANHMCVCWDDAEYNRCLTEINDLEVRVELIEEQLDAMNLMVE